MYRTIAVALATLVLSSAALAQEAPDAMVRRTTAAYDECLRAAGVAVAAPSPA